MNLINIALVAIHYICVCADRDPDVNYHLNHLQTLQTCNEVGYSYPVPSIQLGSEGVKKTSPQTFLDGMNSATANYQSGQAATLISSYRPNTQSTDNTLPYPPFLFRPNVAYAGKSSSGTSYTTSSESESHGYVTSTGLSAFTKTVTPLATYAQAPILSKITAAPLIAKYSINPAKTSYITKNLLPQQPTGSLAKSSLNSNSLPSGGPVVAQVIAAPTVRYATSPALKAEQAQLQYATTAAMVSNSQSMLLKNNIDYRIPIYSPNFEAGLTMFSGVQYPQIVPTQIVTHPSSPVTQTQYSTRRPLVQVAPFVTQHTISKAPYSLSASGESSQYSSTSSLHNFNPVLHGAAETSMNVDVKFVNNYNTHPQYAFEYGVHDVHTGDIKHHKEQRDGEVVRGQYSLMEADGTVRTVDYMADWKTGFHANVHNSKPNYSQYTNQ